MVSANESLLPLLLVNVACAVLALGVGVVAGWWCFGSKPRHEDHDEPDNEADNALEKRLAAERALMASHRLQDLAIGVATDVGDHNEAVRTITEGLKQAESADTEAREAIVSEALIDLVEANESLQARLAKAEEQIKAQAREIEAHESEARTDSLTQLANRRAFDNELGRRFAEWQRKATPFSLMILDVDHFKKFNDTHGHQAGDEVLRRVAESLGTTCREMDIVCRYGGEEFAIILPATVARDAKGLVERLRQGIESLEISFEGKSLNVTASFGLAQINLDDDEHRLLKRADDALYSAKDAGRNRAYLHSGEELIPLSEMGNETSRQAAKPATNDIKIPTRILDGLANRTRFSEELRRRVSESHRTSDPLAVVAVEVEGYDKLQSEYGEAVGRLTLDSVAQFLQSTLRDMDLLGRLCDGKFVIMLPKNDAQDAQLVTQRIDKALAKCAVPIGGEELRLEASMCVATLATEDSAASLLARAEQGLGADSLAHA